MQYVSTANDDGVPHYIVGRINQSVVRVVMRMTYMITPNLSIQYYGQPFGTAGKYTDFKSITAARASRYEERFIPLSPVLSNSQP